MSIWMRMLAVMVLVDRSPSDPSSCHGQPMVRGLRHPVENLLELLASGMTIDEVLEDHPELERDGLLAALEFGALAAGRRRITPLGAASSSHRQLRASCSAPARRHQTTVVEVIAGSVRSAETRRAPSTSVVATSTR